MHAPRSRHLTANAKAQGVIADAKRKRNKVS